VPWGTIYLFRLVHLLLIAKLKVGQN
jgi:hypothetical protein